MTEILQPKSMDSVLAFVGGAIGGLYSGAKEIFLFTADVNLGHIAEYTINVVIGGFITMGFKYIYDYYFAKPKGGPGDGRSEV